MTTTLDREDQGTQTPGADLDPKRFRALAIIALSQLMVVLDASVVIIALPSAQRSLHISTANRQWMLTAYTLSFAGLLLLGGRIADYLGRKRMFVISLIGFAAAHNGDFHSFRVTHGQMGTRIQPVSMNRLNFAPYSPAELEWVDKIARQLG